MSQYPTSSMHRDPDVLDEVEFLVRSANRLDLLAAIRDRPRTRRELRAVTDSSRVTLSRILGDLEDRGWIERVDGRYEPTPEGSVVAREVARLFDNLGTVENLGETLRWLPVEAFDFELARLADATVVTPTERDLTAPITRTARRVREARRVRNVATGVSAEVIDAYLADAEWDRSCESVLHARVFDFVEGDPNLCRKLAELVAVDHVSVYRYDGEEPPVMLTVCDDVVVLCGRSDSRSSPEGVETDDPAVRAWATDAFESYRENAEPVDTGAFTA